MMSKEEATRYAAAFLQELYRDLPGGIVLLLDKTIERPYGWVFFHQSQRYMETKDWRELLAGNSPILIESQSGRLTFLGTGYSAEESLRRLEDSGVLVGPVAKQ